MKYDGEDRNSVLFWERELCAEDIKTASCMQELPSVIDLPGEDELLRYRVQKRTGLTCSLSGEADGSFQNDPLAFSNLWTSSAASTDLLSDIIALNEHWGLIFSKYLPRENKSEGIAVLVLYGVLSGYALDITAAGDSQPRGLRKALYLRILRNFKKLLEYLKGIEVTTELQERHFDAVCATAKFIKKLLNNMNNETEPDK